MGHSFDMLTFDFLLKPPQPFTGLFLYASSLFIGKLLNTKQWSFYQRVGSG